MRWPSALLALLLTSSTAEALVWPNEVERTERALVSDDPRQRRDAAARLSRLPPETARRLVRIALGDDDPDVRLLAVGVASDLRLEGLGKTVAPWLTEPDARLRRAAAAALRLDPSREAIAALARALSDPDVTVRLAAAEALGESESGEAIFPLLGRLDDQHPDVRRAVVHSLGRLRDARAVVPLVGKAQDSVAEVRREVAIALGRLGDPRGMGALVLLLDDREESVRAAALDALGRLGVTDATAAILSLLMEERRGMVRRAAYAALGRIGGKQAVDALIRQLSRDHDSRDDVVAALAAAGAGPRLRQCVETETQPDIAGGCAQAYAASGVADAGKRIAEAMRRGVIRPRAGLSALATRGDPATLPTVLTYLADSDARVRAAAVQAAAILIDPAAHDGRAVRPIIEAMQRTDPRGTERLALVALLGRTGSPLAAAHIRPFLDASDDTLRRVAMRALGDIGGAAAEKMLLDSLDDEAPEVRYEAAVALQRAGTRAAAGPLLDRYERAGRQDRGALAIALSGPARHVTNEKLVRRLTDLAQARRGAERDALLDALGAVPGAPGSKGLLAVLKDEPDPSTRAKVAEALATHPEALGTLRRLARDGTAAVRANAAWSLGHAGQLEDRRRLTRMLADPDMAVAANAAGALGLMGRRGQDTRKSLCAALTDSRAHVRANAASGLSLLRATCEGVDLASMLRQSPSELARVAAARLLASVPEDERSPRAARALSRCIEEDPSGKVAAECAATERDGGSDRRVPSVLVFVVPEGRKRARERIPFTLVLPDGLMRLGLTDRRGAVRMVDVPDGELRLEVAAPLSVR